MSVKVPPAGRASGAASPRATVGETGADRGIAPRWDRLSRGERLLLVGFALAVGLPFVPLLVASFSFRWHFPSLLPTAWLWDARGTTPFPVGWDYLFSPVSGLGTAFVNTVVIAAAATALCLLVSLPAARALARYPFRGKSVLEFFLLTPVIVPDIAIGLGLLIIFILLGLAGSLPGIVFAHLIPTMPYAIRILTSVFQNLSRDYEEQARTLGANVARTLWYVTIPMVMPGVVTAALFAFLISSNVFLLTFFISRGEIHTLPTLLFAHLQGGAALEPVTAGLAIIVSLPGLVFLLLSDRLIRDDQALAQGFGGRRD